MPPIPKTIEGIVDMLPLQDGIYFDLPEVIYRADEALGSSDMKKLLRNPADYWYSSPLNPHQEQDPDTKAKLRGRAMHTLVFHGSQEFDAIYIRGAEHSDQMTSTEKSALTKASNLRAAKLGRLALPVEDYDRIIISAAMIVKNPQLVTAFQGGAGEVSIFWTRDGVRRKGRIDYLKPRGLGDLKSITNIRQIEFSAACRNAIATYRYDLQAAHYLEARHHIDHLQIMGNPTPEQIKLINRCRQTGKFAFQFVFLQADKSPLTWGTILSPQNPILEIARRELEIAADNYKAYLDKFGREMWLLLDEPRELDINDMPSWFGR